MKNIFNLLMDVVSEKISKYSFKSCGRLGSRQITWKKSHDIDIAINNMSGADFAKLAIEYMNENNLDVDGICEANLIQIIQEFLKLNQELQKKMRQEEI